MMGPNIPEIVGLLHGQSLIAGKLRAFVIAKAEKGQ
jgi:hypothetical protein